MPKKLSPPDETDSLVLEDFPAAGSTQSVQDRVDYADLTRANSDQSNPPILRTDLSGEIAAEAVSDARDAEIAWLRDELAGWKRRCLDLERYINDHKVGRGSDRLV